MNVFNRGVVSYIPRVREFNFIYCWGRFDGVNVYVCVKCLYEYGL